MNDTPPAAEGDDGAESGVEEGDDAEDPPSRAGGVEACEGFGVGPSGMARLTRDEYVRTVRDLLGVTVPVALLSGDGRLGPFAANTDTTVEVNIVRKYRAAAEAAAEAATADLATLAECAQADPSDACAESIIVDLGRRAYRRPLESVERDQLRATFEAGRDDAGFAHGLALVIGALLQSPFFLYRIELGEPDADPGSVFALTEYEVASRMSFLLWGSGPDDALLDAAAGGQLRDDAAREAYAEQMLDDPRAAEGIGRIYAGLFGATAGEPVVRDPVAFPEFSDALIDDMQAEVADVSASIVLEDEGSLSDLLLSTRSRVSPELAALYGVAIPPGATPEASGLYEVELPPEERSGMLTRAGVMTLGSHDHISAPMKRANHVMLRLMCRKTPPPPPDVDDASPEVPEGSTLRAELEAKTAAPGCQVCHESLNAIGFAFEHYDALGRYRDTEGGQSIDASGELLDIDVAGAFEGPIELSRRLADSAHVSDCVLAQHATFGLLRPLDASEDACLLQELRARHQPGDSLKDLLLAIVAQPSFTQRRVAEFVPPAPEEDE